MRVGFPAGIEAILAKADADVVRAVLESAGTSTGRISHALPLVTRARRASR